MTPPPHKRQQIQAEVLECTDMGPKHPGHIRLMLSAPAIAAHALPGQFIHALPNSADMILRRPFSIMKTDDVDGTVTILFRVIGEGTRLLAGIKPLEFIDIIGPLGNGFPVIDNKPFILIGGGVGIPPIVFLAKHIKEKSGKKDITVYLGAKDTGTLICESEFKAMGFDPIVATEDGSVGIQGFVTKALEMDTEKISGNTIIYACGPIPMLAAVSKWALGLEMECYVSMENKLGCGIGACLGCSIPIRMDDKSVRYQRICTEGPAFEAGKVMFDKM